MIGSGIPKHLQVIYSNSLIKTWSGSLWANISYWNRINLRNQTVLTKKNRKKNKKHIVTLLHLNSSTDSLVTNCPSLWTLGQDKHLSFYFEHYSKWSVNHNQYLRSNCPSTLIGRALFSVNSCYAVITLSKAKFLCGQISDRVYAAKQIDIQIKGNQHLAGITIF